jgi:hypothetical protein
VTGLGDKITNSLWKNNDRRNISTFTPRIKDSDRIFALRYTVNADDAVQEAC